MGFEEFRGQPSGGMVVEIRRQIGDANFVVAINCTIPQRLLWDRIHPELSFRAFKLQRSVIAVAQQRQWRDDRLCVPYTGINLNCQAGGAFPITKTKRRIGQTTKCITMPGINRQGFIKTGECLRQMPQILQSMAAVVVTSALSGLIPSALS